MNMSRGSWQVTHPVFFSPQEEPQKVRAAACLQSMSALDGEVCDYLTKRGAAKVLEAMVQPVPAASPTMKTAAARTSHVSVPLCPAQHRCHRNHSIGEKETRALP